MKRVHDYTGATSPPEQVPPPVQPALPGPKRHNSTHKRKPAPSVEDMTKKRQKMTTTKAPSAATAAASTQHRLAQEKQKLQSEWTERKARLQQRVGNIHGPQDMNCHLQASEDLAALSKIAARLNELGWMQYRVLFSRFYNLEISLFVLNIAGFVPMPWISQECFCYGFAWLPSCPFLLFFKPGFKATDYHREDLPFIPEHIPPGFAMDISCRFQRPEGLEWPKDCFCGDEAWGLQYMEIATAQICHHDEDRDAHYANKLSGFYYLSYIVLV
jgi:hypothetical protein